MIRIVSRFAGIGDALLANTIAAALGKQENKKVWVASNHSFVFQNNPYVRVLPWKSRRQLDKQLGLMRRLGISFQHDYMDYDHPRDRHLLEVLAERVGLKEVPTKPLYFGPIQMDHSKVFTKDKPQVLIQGTANETWTRNKSYFKEEWEELIASRPEVHWIQVGLASDEPLHGASDCRGKLSLSAGFSLLAQADAFVGTVGFWMHAAAAVNTPGVIVYGGFEAPHQSGYAMHQNLFTTMECSPCWKADCPYDKACMRQINPEHISQALDLQLNV